MSLERFDNRFPTDERLDDNDERLDRPTGDVFHSPQKRAQRLETWLKYIHEQAPFGVKKDSEALGHLLQLTRQEKGVTPEESFYFHFLYPQLSSFGYPYASISKMNRKNMYGPRRRFRNEWWSLSGQIGEAYFAWHIWRHTEIPEALWENGRDPKCYSYLKVSTTLWGADGTSITQTTPIYCEAGGILELLDTPFGVQFNSQQQQSWLPENKTTLFPATLTWQLGDAPLQLHLNNKKPVFMMTSNGCVMCKDGVGLKNYTFPSVAGDGEFQGKSIHFEGSFQHSWEAGMLPEGFPASLLLRTFTNIEKSLISAPLECWIFFIFHLSNNVQLSGFGFPNDMSIAFHPTVATMAQANGTIYTPNCQTLLLKMENEKITSITGETTDQLTFVACAGQSPDESPVIGYTHVAGTISGMWSGASVTGFGFLQRPTEWFTKKSDNFPNRAQSMAETLLDQKYPQATTDMKEWVHHTSFFAASPNSTDAAYSWLIWFLPVIIITCLLCGILYLMWIRKRHQNKPWAQTHQKHWFFK